jgi:hypothetical protein
MAHYDSIEYVIFQFLSIIFNNSLALMLHRIYVNSVRIVKLVKFVPEISVLSSKWATAPNQFLSMAMMSAFCIYLKFSSNRLEVLDRLWLEKHIIFDRDGGAGTTVVGIFANNKR